MKKYNKFINEKLGDKFIKGEDVFEYFTFVIDVRHNGNLPTPNDIYEFETNKNIAFDIFNKYRNFNWEKHNLSKNAWAWEIELIKVKGIDKVYNINISFISGQYSKKDNQITLDEFLDVGLDNIEEYIEIKNNTKKYNL